MRWNVGYELESEGDGDVIAGGDGRRDEHIAEDAAIGCYYVKTNNSFKSNKRREMARQKSFC